MQLDILQVCDYPGLCFFILLSINIIRFAVRYVLEDYLLHLNKIGIGPDVLDISSPSKILEQPINMKNGVNGTTASSGSSNITRSENNRRIDNIVRGGPIGGNQGLPEGTIIRGNEAILPQGVRMDPTHDTTPNFSEIPNNNIHPSNNPATRPLHTIFATQQPTWGDSSNFPVGATNGPFRIFDPNNQIRNGYNANGVNQPALHNICMALNEQTYKANTSVPLSKDMFTDQQEKFILDHLQVVNRRLYVRLTGDSAMTGARRTVIPWNTVTNNNSFVRNFPTVNYSFTR